MKNGDYIYINFSDLNENTQNELFEIAKENVEKEQGKEILEEYPKSMYDQILWEKAERELYSLNVVFNI